MVHTKIKSSCKTWTCKLVRTPKLIALCKKIAHNSFIIGFKYDPRTTYNALINSAKDLMRSSKLDAVVANTVINGRYKAYIVTEGSVSSPAASKNELIKKLASLLYA
jgi:phosphopantothenoylcysteine synthetase/decarboxylase